MSCNCREAFCEHTPFGLSAMRAQYEEQCDERGVDIFSQAMRSKLRAKRDQGRGGWHDPDQCTVEYLADMLIEHIAKGDPVDIANFCMMLDQRGADRHVIGEAMKRAGMVKP